MTRGFTPRSANVKVYCQNRETLDSIIFQLSEQFHYWMAWRAYVEKFGYVIDPIFKGNSLIDLLSVGKKT